MWNSFMPAILGIAYTCQISKFVFTAELHYWLILFAYSRLQSQTGAVNTKSSLATSEQPSRHSSMWRGEASWQICRRPHLSTPLTTSSVLIADDASTRARPSGTSPSVPTCCTTSRSQQQAADQQVAGPSRGLQDHLGVDQSLTVLWYWKYTEF